MHTPLCKHAIGEPEEYATVAEKRGLKGIIITCHNPGPDGWSPNIRMALDQFDEYITMVERARQAWSGRIDVRLGIESDYMPGMESWLEELHGWANFNYVLGSVHPHAEYYKEAYFKDDVLGFQQIYFQHLAMAAETGLFDSLAHPDLVKTVFPSKWDVQSLLDDIQHSLDRIARTGVAMELNTSGLQKRIKEMNPGRLILQEMQQRSIPVVLGSDAHEPKRVADDFDSALDLLEDVGYTYVCFFLERQRHKVSLTDVRESLLTLNKVKWF
jgi:histidinol-phosphatase (PHP family)